jgi:O-antigen/teichoic acid export membrane protein
VVARLLQPDDFGLFGIAGLTIAAVEMLSATGIESALVQRRGAIDNCLNTAWAIQAGRAVLLGLVVAGSAPWVAWFFSDGRVVPVLRVMSLGIVLRGTANVGLVTFVKRLAFRRLFVLDAVVTLTDVVVAVVLAITFRSVWALVGAFIAAGVARSIASFALHPFRPSFNVEWARVRELAHYGKWVLLSSVCIFVGSQLDNLVVGKMAGMAALGVYAMAYDLSLLPLEGITYPISRISIPTFAALQDNPQRLRSAYDRILQIAVFLSVPACVGLAVIAPFFVTLGFGAKWAGATFPLQLLLVGQAVKSVVSPGAGLFYGAGAPRYDFYMQAARSVVLGGLVVPFTYFFGLAGAAIAVVGSSLAMVAPYFRGIRRLLGPSVGRIIRSPALALACSVPMTLVMVTLIRMLGLGSRAPLVVGVSLAAVIGLGAATYFAALATAAHCLGDVMFFKDGMYALGAIRQAFRRRVLPAGAAVE